MPRLTLLAPPGGAIPPIIDSSAIPPLELLPPPALLPAPKLTIALPQGAQTQIPGALWPDVDIWAASERRARAGEAPAIEIRQLTRKESNILCAQWHPLGAERRPFGYHAFALFVDREPLALATAATAHSASIDKEFGLYRPNTIELTRLCRGNCAKARWTLRVMLRLWREFLALPYWPYFEDVEKVALITYLMPGCSGHIYKLDGWERLRACRAWGGGGTWSNGPRAGEPPDSLWAYWLAGKRPANADAILARRAEEEQAAQDARAQHATRPARQAA